ncbi:putative protein kinase RLK-Pelle-WAK family [Rosa chinensis]|uniref:Protein kinase domain-containing protein n=1 Tax=Rosa chinensis TaxID=74649 RepID=A0A2P6SPT6_ROSCH|nr:putative protein kinase RLK-Pelle-WAK family [Rosa chinensis]
MLACNRAGLCICCSFLVFGFTGIVNSIKKQNSVMLKSEFFKKNGRLLLKQHIDASQYGSTMICTAEELQMATEFYKKKHFFGPGGDGGSTVYDKGFLVEEPQVEHFMNDIIALTKIGHRNLRTLGYLDPEYLVTGQLTDKSDVYSFGVVLLEILTGEMSVCFKRPESQRIMTSHFVLSMEQNCISLILAPQSVVNEGNREQVRAVAELAKRCLKLSSAERPAMEEVAKELKLLYEEST